ncbi:HAMP domain-containing protein [Roseomonas nepalensis]|uniref:HAMP domain-containing protein n=1 Tax=Muricoccus nepalensis TaxID=1854500 RepID=A0A502G8X4_9PROT|nr:methyl-accepting chemotaxis protein [Roseomonas nepalensis]TPG58082.1 HAMP domain-containing protein [Roseomonas nepalensis]
MRLARLVPASIGLRVAAALLLLGGVALAGAAVTYVSTGRHAEAVDALARAQGSLPLVERLRGGAYAVVMESRGLYIANDARQAATFAERLRGHLADMEASWAALRPILPPGAAEAGARLEQPLRDFVALRTELARAGVEEGPQAANRLGNNDANRSARTRFTDALDALPPLVAAATEAQRGEINADGDRLAVRLLAGTALAVVLVVGLALALMQRSVVRPLRRLTAALGEMAEGRLHGTPLPPPGPGEVGGIAAAAAAFRVALQRNASLEAASAANNAARDRRQAAMDRLTQDFGTAVSGVLVKLGTAADGVRGTAAEVAEAARATHAEMEATVGEAEGASGGLNAAAAATEELTASIAEISRQVAQAARTAERAAGQARATDGTVQGLAEAASRIGEVVRLISDIAGQTNLLALNATIEAARAGEAGRGFAVVAGEVKGLAAETAAATGRIAEQVAAIQSATEAAVGAVRGVAEAIGEVSEVATAIAAAVEEQGAATREIAQRVHGVAASTETSTRAMRGAAGAAERSGEANQVVRRTAEGVARLTGTLREEVDHFLAAMRNGERSGERRRYERVPGRDARARLRCEVHGAAEGRIVDISFGGAAIECAWPCDVGAEILVGLPGGGEPVPARAVGGRDGVLALSFRQDPEALAGIGRALDAIAERPLLAA